MTAVEANEQQRFAATFADFWQAPSPEGLTRLLHDDALCIQPLSPTMNGRPAMAMELAKILRFLPDLRAAVDRWSAHEGRITIEFRLIATVAGRPLEWTVVDRFVLRDGRATVRITHFDSLPLLLTIARHPSTWWRWLRSGAARPWRVKAVPVAQ